MIRRQYSVSCSKQRTRRPLPQFFFPTARLELAQLAPLPPQDSVSTNFTTSARIFDPPGEDPMPGKPPCVTSEYLLPWSPHQQALPAFLQPPKTTPKQSAIVPVLASDC